MSAAEVLTRLRVVRATRPASRKFQGTILFASSSMCDCPSDLRESAVWTSETIERSLVLAVLARTRTRMLPSSTTVPANTSSPTERSTASGSPVRVAWLTMALPRSTTPSMEMDMPVRTATRSPGSSSVAGTLTSVSPSTFCALSGTSSRELMSSFSLMARV